MNIIVVKFGRKYSADEVNFLTDRLEDIGPVWCYTDDPTGVKVKCIEPIKRLNGVWNKLALFSEDFLIQGEILYVDIDTLVNYIPYKEIKCGRTLRLIHNNSKEKLISPTNYDVTINSSIMVFDNTLPEIREIWDHFTKSGLMDYFMRKYIGIDRYIFHEGFETNPHSLSTSWKYDYDHDRPFITFEESHDDYLRESAKIRGRNL